MKGNGEQSGEAECKQKGQRHAALPREKLSTCKRYLWAFFGSPGFEPLPPELGSGELIESGVPG